MDTSIGGIHGTCVIITKARPLLAATTSEASAASLPPLRGAAEDGGHWSTPELLRTLLSACEHLGRYPTTHRREVGAASPGHPSGVGQYGGVTGCNRALPGHDCQESMGADPDDLKPDTRVRFPGDPDIVSLVQVKPGAYWDFVFRTAGGGLIGITLDESEVGDIEIVSTDSVPTFEGDPRRFRLGVEALRIENAFRHDMAALAVSNISPLPHQLDAVYGAFLDEPRLRFLLADDPGAGKTIMAGLYIKELMLRRAADRVLIVTPANLRPQWQRELAERFEIHFVQLDSAMFDATPTQNPWDAHDLVIVSRDFLKREAVADAFAAAEKDWDLAVIDEAHGYTLQVDAKGAINKRSERYRAGERIAEKAHRLILLTATPHSGRNESMWGLLRLLDPDAYGDRCPKKLDLNPTQYRKVAKEQMVDMAGNKLFRPRYPHTMGYELQGEELDLYDAVTNFVSKELAEIRGQAGRGAAGFALTTMQRRLASSVRAIKRTLERRVDRLERALADPEAYLRNRRDFQAGAFPEDPDDVGDLDEDDLWKLEEQALAEWLPSTIVELEAELEALRPLLVQAQESRGRRHRAQAERAAGRRGQGRSARRPEQEAPHLHRAQGHARLPRREAGPRLRHRPHPRRDEAA